MKRGAFARLVLVFSFACFLGGCTFVERFNREWRALLIVVRGGSSPLAKRKARPSVRPSGEVSDEASWTEEERQEVRTQKAHQELLYEIYTAVLLRSPSEKEFQAFVGVLNQGASLEGIYNGFTHSSDFRRLEVLSGPAAPSAVKVFSEVLSGLELELTPPTAFDSFSAQPLEVLEANRLAEPTASVSPQPLLSQSLLKEGYEKIFEKASVFTLKRILGDEALKVLAVKRKDPQKLALWYSKWVVKMTEQKVDFGLPLRNKPDEQFHYMWAMRAPEDRLKWEVLNRVHRVLKPRG